MMIYFDNCLSSCKNAVIELADHTPITQVLHACQTKWGEGSLVRMNKELIYRHDHDAKWIGCCAEKVYGIKSKQ